MRELLEEKFFTEGLKSAKISVKVCENGKTLGSINEELSLIPASNLKLVITAAALIAEVEELFPPLESWINGSVFEGTVHGDLVIDACGSLVFSGRHQAKDEFLRGGVILESQVLAYVKQLQKFSLKVFLGDLKLRLKRWNNLGENEFYQAATPFSFHENTVDTMVKKGKILTVPESPEVFKFIENSHVAKQEKDEKNIVYYNGKIDSQDFWRVSNFSGSEYGLAMLKKRLQKNGIQFLQSEELENKEPIKLFETPSFYKLEEFIVPLNRESDNFRAELLALCLVRAIKGEASYHLLEDVILEIFKKNKLDFSKAKIVDGSGLSEENRLSSGELMAILWFMRGHKSFKTFLNSLSLAGQFGTLKNRFKGTVWEGNFYGKTGTLNGVTALSGYWMRRKKEPILFSFIGNGVDNGKFWKALEDFSKSLEDMA